MIRKILMLFGMSHCLIAAGCVAVVGGAAAGAGVYSYMDGQLTLSYQAPFDKILDYIDIGKNEGAECLTGGSRHGDEGYFVEPTLFSGVTDEMKIAQDEIFGPVLSVLTFRDLDEVVHRANISESH